MVKYMIDREVNPMEFADLVNINASLPVEKVSPKNKMDKKNVGIAEIMVAFAILVVLAFFVGIFL